MHFAIVTLVFVVDACLNLGITSTVFTIDHSHLTHDI